MTVAVKRGAPVRHIQRNPPVAGSRSRTGLAALDVGNNGVYASYWLMSARALNVARHLIPTSGHAPRPAKTTYRTGTSPSIENATVVVGGTPEMGVALFVTGCPQHPPVVARGCVIDQFPNNVLKFSSFSDHPMSPTWVGVIV